MGFFDDFVRPSNNPHAREIDYDTLPKKAKQRAQSARDAVSAKKDAAKDSANKARGKNGKCHKCKKPVWTGGTHCNPCAKSGF